MSDLLPISIIIGAILGGPHCLGMCGPIISLTAKNNKQIFFYHIGRMLSYILIGSIAGAIGSVTIGRYSSSIVAISFSLLFGNLFIFLGIVFLLPLFKINVHLSFFKTPLKKIFSKLSLYQKKFPNLLSFVIGFLAITLPCGLLYTAVIGAATSSSMIKGGLYLFLFWLGTLPILTFLPLFFKDLFRPLMNKSEIISGILFIIGGIIIISRGIMLVK